MEIGIAYCYCSKRALPVSLPVGLLIQFFALLNSSPIVFIYCTCHPGQPGGAESTGPGHGEIGPLQLSELLCAGELLQSERRPLHGFSLLPASSQAGQGQSFSLDTARP